MIDREKIMDLVAEELEDANKKYPLFHSPHEAYAVLLEEVEELEQEVDWIKRMMALMWIDIKSDTEIKNNADSIYAHAIHAAQEAIQCAAMAMKIKQSELYKE